MLVEMTAFRQEYTDKSCALFGDIKTNIMNSDDTQFSESQHAYEWATLMRTLLTALIKVQKSEGTQRALNKLLDDGLAKLGADLAMLTERTQCINSLKSRTTELMSKFDTESIASLAKWREMNGVDKGASIQTRGFMHQPDKINTIIRFHDDVSRKLSEDVRKIDSTKAKLWDEIESIDHLKSKIDPIKASLNSDAPMDDLKQPAQDLIDECEKYRERYNQTPI